MQILLSLMSGVALLIWGAHVTRHAMIELLGPRLRLVLAAGTASPARGFLAGLGVTALIQSSSATALMTSAFVAGGLVSLPAALPIVLGADVGTSLMARLLSLDIAWLSPLLLVIGIALRLSGKASPRAQAGEVLVGLGLITLALQLIRLYAAPLLHAAIVRAIFTSLGNDPLLALVIGALVTLLAYSSLATVLLTATLAMGGVIGPATALPLVLGANLGSGLIACLANAGSSPAARRVSLANLIFRFVGMLAFLPLLDAIPWLLARLGSSAGTMAIDFHMAFNLALAATLIWFVKPVAALCTRWLPDAHDHAAPGGARYLSQGDLRHPSVALGNATREVVRIGDVIEDMLDGMKLSIVGNDRAANARCRALDDRIDDLYSSVKMYLTDVDAGSLDGEDAARWDAIMLLNINLEYAGDIVERILADLDQRKLSRNFCFSDEGSAELLELCDMLVASLRTRMSLFVANDRAASALLLECAGDFQARAERFTARHIARVAQRRTASVETSGLHLDILRELSQMNALLCAAPGGVPGALRGTLSEDQSFLAAGSSGAMAAKERLLGA
ncbi:Na/Pi cotransporter family protein [Cupriavidus sp. MP-37]|uniref:Na/Pi cotransporter family protein n=1 Tax=Cupriavidus sp. MP-37 TaxID=2884455 RepID=UPI001D0B751D|nr:Na/Pi cotransporter family protein [Cupriavidus sp. MP-37]UDM53649.1 Na/Pi cotransporter family protein [Cupriavidus sp. MP-37]